MKRGRCRYCRKRVPLRKDGTVGAHLNRDRNGGCIYVGSIPEPEEDASTTDLLMAARAAVEERDAMEVALLEWHARGGKGWFDWPRVAHERLRQMLNREAPR